MKYAIVKINGFQFKVKEGDQIEVSRSPIKDGEKTELKDVLLYNNEGKLKVGNPYLKDVKVEAKVLKHFLDEKIFVRKFKAKTGYRRKTGFRAQKTLLGIEKIVA